MNQNQHFGKGSAGSDVHQESIQELWSKTILSTRRVRKDVKYF